MAGDLEGVLRTPQAAPKFASEQRSRQASSGHARAG
jgi:hypothetical protein